MPPPRARKARRGRRAGRRGRRCRGPSHQPERIFVGAALRGRPGWEGIIDRPPPSQGGHAGPPLRILLKPRTIRQFLRPLSLMSKILGIDLGTTNSCAAIVEATVPVVLANREGSRTTASIVAFSEEGDRLVGQIAKRQAITNTQNTVFPVKRMIGRKITDPNVAKAREVLPYTLTRAPNSDVKIEIRDRQYSPEEISAFILAEIKDFSQEVLGEEVREAVITVPAYFDDSQR